MVDTTSGEPNADLGRPDPSSPQWLIFQIGRIISGLDEVRSGMGQIREEVQGLRASHQDLRTDVVGLVAKIDAADERIREIETDVAPLVALGARVTVCETAIAEMRPTFEKTKDAWSRIRGALLLVVALAGIVGFFAAFARDIVTIKVGLR